MTYTIYQKVYPLFLRQAKGEARTKEVTAVTVNQVYYSSYTSLKQNIRTSGEERV